MAGTGASSPFIKDEPEDQFFSSHNQRYMGNSQQGFGSMPQQHFSHFGSHSIDPNDLAMGNNGMAIPNSGHDSSFQNNFSSESFNHGATFGDDELRDSLGSQPHSNHVGMQNSGHDFGNIDFDYQQNMFAQQNNNGNGNGNGVGIDTNYLNGYSNTPDGDPIQSPFVHNFNHAQFRHMVPAQPFGSPQQSYTGSAHGDPNGLDGRQRPRLVPGVQGRKPSSTRSPLTPKMAGLPILSIGSSEQSGFPTQPIRTNQRHQKSVSGQWDHTPNSLNSTFGGSEFSSPIAAMHSMQHNPQIVDVLKTGSLPPKLGVGPTNSLTQRDNAEIKRRRRRESHNLVERRRRDNINERIQELSHLVPMHRLEDEKVRKALQNNSPLSPTLGGLSAPPNGMSPPQATSGLAGPGARRATAGNITTGIPLEEKDKGPNKGDILNGAVSWTRDLMWMLNLKLQQQEDLANLINDLGGVFPYEQTEEEKRMHTELMDAMVKNDSATFSYSRHTTSGLRVPTHTDMRGDPLNNRNPLDSLSPDNHSTGDSGQGMGGAGQYWSGHNSGGSGAGSVNFKEEDEYGMDLTQ